MPQPLTIVMYHYVRDVDGTRYAGLKTRSIGDFRGQLDHMERHYTPVTMEQVLGAVQGGPPLPANAILLTFDDGFAEHCETVFPMLAERGVQGSFFPAAQPIVDGCVLAVHKLQFVLASVSDTPALVSRVFDAIAAHRAGFGLDEPEAYWDAHAVATRLYPADVMFVKRMLQHELPEPLRDAVLSELFRDFVSPSEQDFARDLYMSSEQIRRMARAGMYIGSHGSAHRWMDRLSPSEQASDVDASLDFLRAIGCLATPWVMCYPYGRWNDSLIDVLRSRGCALGLTIEVAVADLASHNPLTLPRLDTVDLPVTV